MVISFTNGHGKWFLAGGGVLLISAAAWGLTAHFRPTKDPLGLPPELSPERLKADSADPQKLRQTIHTTMERTDLTDAQREEIRHRMRVAWEARMDQRMKEYFTASAEEKQAILDRQIDEMQKEMKEREAARAQHEQADRPHDGQDRPHRPDFASQTPQQRKARFESRDPDRMAQHMAYFQALSARATARGIQMPFGGGRGGFGGPGGGRGGPH